MNNPKVSVIIPAYNCRDYIVQAVRSVLEQDVSLEILVIDDCSTDGLPEALEPFVQRNQICYVRNESNLGVAAARNRGISMAAGQYVAFLDGDDWWEPGKLSRQIQCLQESQAVLCSTGRRLCTEEGRKTNTVIGVKDQLSYRQLLYHNSICCSSVVLLTTVAKEFPMEHDECHEDYLCWLRIAQKYGVFCAVDLPLVNYRVTETGKSRNKWKSAKMTYQVYSYMGLPLFKKIFYFLSYLFHGVLKYS